QPLLPTPGASIPERVTVLKTDTIPMPPVNPAWRQPRALVSVEIHNDPQRFEIVIYHNTDRPRVCIKDIYRIPGLEWSIYLLAFQGNPYDHAETHVPVLVGGASLRPRHVEWLRDPEGLPGRR